MVSENYYATLGEKSCKYGNYICLLEMRMNNVNSVSSTIDNQVDQLQNKSKGFKRNLGRMTFNRNAMRMVKSMQGAPFDSGQ